MSKEFKRFFSDKRLAFTTIILPGLMIYIIYSIMGDGLMSAFSVDEDYKAKVYSYNAPESAYEVAESVDIELIKTDDIEGVKEQISEKECDALLIFPENFDEIVGENKDGTDIPEIEIIYNQVEPKSSVTLQKIQAVFEAYRFELIKPAYNIKATDVATAEDSAGMIFSMMLPMLLMIFIFTSCMGVAPESIAGEKERGTIATLLVSPIKRSEIAIGKILSLSGIALMSGTSSFLGVMLSLPKLMGADAMEGQEIMDVSVYQPIQFVWVFLIILSSILMINALISVISANAKSVKEAMTLISPLMMVVMFVGIMPMLMGSGDTTAPIQAYIIPFYGIVQCLNDIFSFEYATINIVITIVSNLAYAFGLVFLLTKMFENEKVMFSK